MQRVTLPALVAGVALAFAVPAGAHAATKVVDMGVPLKAQPAFQKLSSDVNDYFPDSTTISVGDSVRFVPTAFHTVDFPARGKGPVPLILPTGQTISGALDAGGNPFWFNGQPELGFNPVLASTNFGKTVTYNGRNQVLSGLPTGNKPAPMTVKFTRAGTYTYFCNLHAGMKATVRVVRPSRRIPSARADARRVARQVARDLVVARRLAKTKPPAGIVDVGSAGPDGVEFFGFFPQTQTISVGTTLTFRMSPKSFEVHTATAGPGNPETQPDSYLGTLAASFQQPVFNPAAVYPSDPPGTPIPASPTSHGNGFWNTGIMDNSSATPPPSSSKVTFTAPGTYQLYCLVHPFMHATVVVR